MDLTKLSKTQRGGALEAPLNILFASSEVAPFSKTGGLGDVAGALPSALAHRGHNVQVITPLYKHIDPSALSLSLRLRTLEVPRKASPDEREDLRKELEDRLLALHAEADEQSGFRDTEPLQLAAKA